MNQRVDVTDDDLMLALKRMSEGLQKRIKEKGRGCFIGLHETDGVLDEEVREWKGEVHANDRMAALEELVDIGVTALFGVASISTAVRVESDAARAAAPVKPPPAKPGAPTGR